METSSPQSEFSGNGQPPFKRTAVAAADGDNVGYAFSIIREMNLQELREFSHRYSLMINANPEKEAFDRSYEESAKELQEHWNPKFKGFVYDSDEYEGYYTVYDFEEIYGRFNYHHKDERPHQLPYMFDFNRKLLGFLKGLGWEEADQVDPTAIW